MISLADKVEKLIKPHEWPDRWQGNEDENLRHRFGTLQEAAIAALSAVDLDVKISLTRIAAKAWFSNSLGTGSSKTLSLPSHPGRPEKPALIHPKRMKKRSLNSAAGRFALLHAITHIELNAVDLAWDIIARFAGQNVPRSFFDGWVRVALEEAKHFSLLRQRLIDLGGVYGDLDAHDGLWDAAQNTEHSLTARLAVVPLILEARGLDITPDLIRKMEEIGDTDSACIFHIIYRDEQGHVAIGAKWFRYLCHREGRDPAVAFQKLVRLHFRGPLKPPFNDSARARAGLTPQFYRGLTSVSR